jgi:hypothetical protein
MTDPLTNNIAVERVKQFVNRIRQLEGEDPVPWDVHEVVVGQSVFDGILVEVPVTTTVPTGYKYIVALDVDSNAITVFPVRDPTVPLSSAGDSSIDYVNHPPHYLGHPSGIECIDVTRHMGFNLGNVVKYIWRAGLKDQTPTLLDLRKAQWYLNNEIDKVAKEKEATHQQEVVRDVTEFVRKGVDNGHDVT